MFSSHISDKMLVIESDVKTEKFSNSQIRSQLESQSEILETSGLQNISRSLPTKIMGKSKTQVGNSSSMIGSKSYLDSSAANTNFK